MTLNIVPVLLGGGARLLDDLGGAPIDLECTRVLQAPSVAHLTYRLQRNPMRATGLSQNPTPELS